MVNGMLRFLNNSWTRSLGKGLEPSYLSPLAICVGLTLLVGSIEAWWLQGPLERDISIYFIIAQELLNGRWLYSDLWDHKPPAIHAAYASAEFLLGRSKFAVWGLSVFLSSVTGCGIALILKRLAVEKKIIIVALFFWGVLSVSPNLEAAQPNTEAFINFFLVWSVAGLILFRGMSSGYLFSALCFGLATLFKPVALIFFLPLACQILARDLLHVTKKYLALSALALAPLLLWIGSSGYFWLTGRWQEYYEAIFEYNRFYAGNILENLQKSFSIERILRSGLGSLWLPTLIGCLSFRKFSSRYQYLVAATWSAAIVVAISLPGNFYLHYYQLALPWILIAFATGLAAVSRRWAQGLAFCSFCGLAIFELSLLLFPNTFHRSPFYPRSLSVQARAVAPYIQHLLAADGWFYEWGAQAELYATTGVSPRHGALHVEWLLSGPMAQTLTDKTLAVLTAQPPELIVISRQFVNARGKDNRLWRWIASNYQEVAQVTGAPDFVVALRTQS